MQWECSHPTFLEVKKNETSKLLQHLKCVKGESNGESRVWAAETVSAETVSAEWGIRVPLSQEKEESEMEESGTEWGKTNES